MTTFKADIYGRTAQQIGFTNVYVRKRAVFAPAFYLDVSFGRCCVYLSLISPAPPPEPTPPQKFVKTTSVEVPFFASIVRIPSRRATARLQKPDARNKMSKKKETTEKAKQN